MDDLNCHYSNLPSPKSYDMEQDKDELYETWDDIEEEYMKDEYPVFGGPFNNAMTPFEWLRKYYNEPKRK